MPHRTVQQEEQLKTLCLERDFERLAQEQGDMEEDNDTNYGKDNMQEVIRLTQNSNQLSTPVTSMKQIDVKTNIVSQTSSNANQTSNNNTNIGNDNNIGQSISNHATAANVQQPKSILKHNNARVERTNNSNPSSPSKQAKSTTFADDQRQNIDNNSVSGMSSVVRDLNNLSFSEYETKSIASPQTSSTSNYQMKEITEMNIDSMNSK